MQSDAIRSSGETNCRKLIRDKNPISSSVKWWSFSCFLVLAKPQLPRGPFLYHCKILFLLNFNAQNLYPRKYLACAKLAPNELGQIPHCCNHPLAKLLALGYMGCSGGEAVAHQSPRAAQVAFPTASHPHEKLSSCSVGTWLPIFPR